MADPVSLLETLPLEMVALATLHPHPRNYQDHPDEELDHLVHSLKTHGWYKNVVIAQDDTLLAGHGVVKAALRAGWTHGPVRRLPYPSDHPEALKVLAGDNEIARLAIRNEPALTALIQELHTEGIPLLGTGWDPAHLEALLAPSATAPDGNYSRTIETPLYEPTGPCPPVGTLADTAKTTQLLAEIDASSLPEDEKAFLRMAARRHTVFNYKLIAEYYAHASAPMQRLMEASALVIIDFDLAIELGYVKLATAIAAQYQQEHGHAG